MSEHYKSESAYTTELAQIQRESSASAKISGPGSSEGVLQVKDIAMEDFIERYLRRETDMSEGQIEKKIQELDQKTGGHLSRPLRSRPWYSRMIYRYLLERYAPITTAHGAVAPWKWRVMVWHLGAGNVQEIRKRMSNPAVDLNTARQTVAPKHAEESRNYIMDIAELRSKIRNGSLDVESRLRQSAREHGIQTPDPWHTSEYGEGYYETEQQSSVPVS